LKYKVNFIKKNKNKKKNSNILRITKGNKDKSSKDDRPLAIFLTKKNQL